MLSDLACCKRDFLLEHRAHAHENSKPAPTTTPRQPPRQPARPTRARAQQIRLGALYDRGDLLSWCLRPASMWRNDSGAGVGTCARLYPASWQVAVRPQWEVGADGFLDGARVFVGRADPDPSRPNGVTSIFLPFVPPVLPSAYNVYVASPSANRTRRCQLLHEVAREWCWFVVVAGAMVVVCRRRSSSSSTRVVVVVVVVVVW